MCRHDSCWGICAWWSVKPDTSGKHFPQDVLFCPCVCLKIPSPGPTWAPPVRRRRTLGGVRVIHAQQDADTSLMVLHYLWILGCALWVACDVVWQENFVFEKYCKQGAASFRLWTISPHEYHEDLAVIQWLSCYKCTPLLLIVLVRIKRVYRVPQPRNPQKSDG